MKIFQFNKKKKIIISKKEWFDMGSRNNWFMNLESMHKNSFLNRRIPKEIEFGYGLDQEAMNLLYKYDITNSNLWRFDDPNSKFQDIYLGIQQAKNGNNEALKEALHSRFG